LGPPGITEALVRSSASTRRKQPACHCATRRLLICTRKIDAAAPPPSRPVRYARGRADRAGQNRPIRANAARLQPARYQQVGNSRSSAERKRGIQWRTSSSASGGKWELVRERAGTGAAAFIGCIRSWLTGCQKAALRLAWRARSGLGLKQRLVQLGPAQLVALGDPLFQTFRWTPWRIFPARGQSGWFGGNSMTKPPPGHPGYQ